MKTKEKVTNVQISSNSDMVLHERFDQDFARAVQNLNILTDDVHYADVLVNKELMT